MREGECTAPAEYKVTTTRVRLSPTYDCPLRMTVPMAAGVKGAARCSLSKVRGSKLSSFGVV